MPESKSQLKLAGQLENRFGELQVTVREHAGQVAMDVKPEHWLEVAQALRDEDGFAFAQLLDLCGVDYLYYGQDEWATSEQATTEGYSRGVEGRAGPGRFSWEDRPSDARINRFATVVQLLSLRHNRRLRLRCFAPDEGLPVVPSLVEVWDSANWFEREAFDLYGIVFEGHPDLRRILTDYGFVGHPFRKDFPLVGNVEVRYDPEKGRVIYQPTTIKPRVLVARTIQKDSRYVPRRLREEAEQAARDADQAREGSD